MKGIFGSVAIAVILSAGSPVIARSSEMASPTVQAEFTEFFARFKAALKANDAAEVAGMAKLPFQNDPSVSNARQFQETIYRETFTKKTRGCIQRGPAIYGRDGERNDSFSVFCDETIFTFTRTPAGFLLTDIGVND